MTMEKAEKENKTDEEKNAESLIKSSQRDKKTTGETFKGLYQFDFPPDDWKKIREGRELNNWPKSKIKRKMKTRNLNNHRLRNSAGKNCSDIQFIDGSERKLILVGEATGEFKLKMARRSKYSEEEWKALNSYVGTTIQKNTKENENGRLEEQRIIVKRYKNLTVRKQVRNSDLRNKPKTLCTGISSRSYQQFEKRKEGIERLETINEENKEPASYPAPSYRGSGVKFHTECILRLGRKDERHLHSRLWESKPEENRKKLLSIMHHQKDSQSLLDRPPDEKNTEIEFREILYHIPLPQPTDRPPDYLQEAEFFLEFRHAVDPPQPQDRPPDSPSGATHGLLKRDQKNDNNEKEQQKVEDWGRESTLLRLRYSDRPPFELPHKCRPNETTEILYLLRYVQRPPFLGGPSYR